VERTLRSALASNAANMEDDAVSTCGTLELALSYGELIAIRQCKSDTGIKSTMKRGIGGGPRARHCLQPSIGGEFG
jgi:hypothetical protein